MSIIVEANWWSKRKFGCISLAVSLAEAFVIYGAAILVQASRQPHPSPLVLKAASGAWIIGGFVSFGFAVAGLVADSHRMTAFVAVIAAIGTFLICGLQMLV